MKGRGLRKKILKETTYSPDPSKVFPRNPTGWVLFRKPYTLSLILHLPTHPNQSLTFRHIPHCTLSTPNLYSISHA